MEIIKRKILLENSVDRNYGSETWGVMTANTFYIKIQLNQTIDDLGLFTDIEFIPKTTTSENADYSVLLDSLLEQGYVFPFMNGTLPQNLTNNLSPLDKVTLRLPQKTVSQYHYYGNNVLTGVTDSKIEDVRSYNKDVPFIVGLDINTEQYSNYIGDIIDGVNQICDINTPKIYVFDTKNDLFIGTEQQETGIQYKDFDDSTTFRFISEGWNQTNTSLSALTKEEFLLGIISRPEVENDVFIDRGVVPVLDYHLRLSEIRNLGQLQQYGNGYYNIDLV
jgi:hypothetical protein